jgi:uncharacterized membrane protein YobD (UPF0266 family)
MFPVSIRDSSFFFSNVYLPYIYLFSMNVSKDNMIGLLIIAV